MLGSSQNQQAPANLLVGQWRVVSGEFAGQALPPAQLPKAILTFEKDGRFRDAEGAEATWVIDESKSPNMLELVHTAGRDRGQRQLAVFEATGERLTIVFGIPGGRDEDRPVRLTTSKDNPKLVLFVFERLKKAVVH
jgi:uncharacterized protein (TIGR03067 family)